MKDMLCRSWWMPALRGVLAISFGALALLWPGLTLLGLLSMFAVYAVLGGAVSAMAAIRFRKTHEDWWLLLLSGIAAMGAGVIAVIHPGITLTVLVLLIGANALVGGILDLSMAIRLRKTLRNELLLILNAAAAIAFGVLVFLFPSAGALAIVWLISIYALASGAMLLALALRLRSARAGTSVLGIERRIHPDRRMAHAH